MGCGINQVAFTGWAIQGRGWKATAAAVVEVETRYRIGGDMGDNGECNAWETETSGIASQGS